MQGIAIKGILENPETKLTKAATPYVVADLITPTTKIKVKNWDATADQLEPFVGKVVEIVGCYKTFNGKETFDFGFNGPDLAITATEEDPADYRYSSPYKPEAMVKTIKKEISSFQNENYKAIANYVLDYSIANGLKEATLPPTHTECSGMLYHLFLVISKIKKLVIPNFRNVDTPPIATEIMITLALLENIGFLSPIFQPEIDELLYGVNINLIQALNILGNMPEKDACAKEMAILTHGLLVLHSGQEPAIQEVAWLKRLSDEELETYHFSEGRRFMSPDEVKNNIFNLI